LCHSGFPHPARRGLSHSISAMLPGSASGVHLARQMNSPHQGGGGAGGLGGRGGGGFGLVAMWFSCDIGEARRIEAPTTGSSTVALAAAEACPLTRRLLQAMNARGDTHAETSSLGGSRPALETRKSVAARQDWEIGHWHEAPKDRCQNQNNQAAERPAAPDNRSAFANSGLAQAGAGHPLKRGE
jgi:hypothetical protein